jgi:hypothetical protein
VSGKDFTRWWGNCDQAKTGELCGADSEFGNGSDRVTVRLAMGAACRRTVPNAYGFPLSSFLGFF